MQKIIMCLPLERAVAAKYTKSLSSDGLNKLQGDTPTELHGELATETTVKTVGVLISLWVSR